MTTRVSMSSQRVPFAPLNESRLQSLTSIKNCQNALPTTLTSPNKRKATTYESDLDSENVDPKAFMSKKSKNIDGTTKPANYVLSKAPVDISCKPRSTSTPRPTHATRSLASKITTKLPSSTTLSTPAGRSPTRNRIGILSRGNPSTPYTRIDPPKYPYPSLNSNAPSTTGLGFSISAALSSTVPSSRSSHRTSRSITTANPSWQFQIYEDTAEELATNLMEHSTCTLDISSDEESAVRSRNSRGKENIPPADDVSQIRSGTVSARVRAKKWNIEVEATDIGRAPLREMNTNDFWPKDVSVDDSFILIDDDGEDSDVKFGFEAKLAGIETGKEVQGQFLNERIDELMRTRSEGEQADKAKLLEPLENGEEGFEVWESGSAKGDE